MKRLITSLLVLGCLGQASALTLIRSDFDTGAEGWTAGNGSRERVWVASGGDPGGFIEASDNGAQQVWVFGAPEAWRGDQSAAIGGTLSWSMKTSTLSAPMPQVYADVKIGGAGLVIAAEAGPPPGLDWTHYSVDFTPGNWRLNGLSGQLASFEQISAVLSAVEFLRLRGDFSAAADTGGLDTVVLTAVPELPSAALALAGLALLGLYRRRAAD